MECAINRRWHKTWCQRFILAHLCISCERALPLVAGSDLEELSNIATRTGIKLIESWFRSENYKMVLLHFRSSLLGASCGTVIILTPETLFPILGANVLFSCRIYRSRYLA